MTRDPPHHDRVRQDHPLHTSAKWQLARDYLVEKFFANRQAGAVPMALWFDLIEQGVAPTGVKKVHDA